MILIFCDVALGVDIYSYSFVSDSSTADAAVVLGAAAWNTQPSPVFAERINHGIGLYREGRVKYLIFTGGAGRDEPVSEAIVARDYAIRNGVAAGDIFYESRSTVTLENLCYSREIIRREHLGRILIVSDPLHMRRSITIARDLGLDAYPSPTPTSRYASPQSKMILLAGESRVYASYLLQRWFTNIEEQCLRGVR